MATRLSLVVIRSRDIDRAVVFYQALGLSFTKHAHGQGPEHYACESEGVVFEVYPQREDAPPTTATRLGFRVTDTDTAFAAAVQAGGLPVSEPRDSPWGRRAVVDDLDGHRVELID